MPRRQQHIENSAAATALAACLADLTIQDARHQIHPTFPPDLIRTGILSALAYAIGAEVGTWPDRLEPATTPRHRDFFHSWSLLGLITWGTVRFLQTPADPTLKWLAGMVATGYAIHLLDDATEKPTSKLPLI